MLPPGEEDPQTEQDDAGFTAPWTSLLQGAAVAIACDALFRIPWTLLRRVVRPEHLVNALGIMLLSVHMLVGYVGGRVAAKAGLSHEDARSQWVLAWVVALCSTLVELAVLRLRPISQGAHRVVAVNPPTMLDALVVFACVVALVRFGFAMGTWAQAFREGRVTDDEDGME